MRIKKSTIELLLGISYCDEVAKAIDNKEHPCNEVVNFQFSNNPNGKWQHPEPWNGNLDTAEILFIGSNPNINFNELDFPTDDVNDKYIINFHINRHDTSRYGKSVRKLASYILDRPVDEVEKLICTTEAVHCKSPSEIGISNKKTRKTLPSCTMCTDKWMTKILDKFNGKYIVILGKTAKDIMESFFEKNPVCYNNKVVIYDYHPSYYMHHHVKDEEIKRNILTKLKTWGEKK